MEQQMLKDKVAVITGASYGMGRTMAELFAEEGAAVVITALCFHLRKKEWQGKDGADKPARHEKEEKSQ